MNRLASLMFVLAALGCRKDVSRTDLDGDGVTAAEGDCGPGDPSTLPDALEVCDGHDNNCDGAVDEGAGTAWFADADGDGFGDADASQTSCFPPVGHVADDSDCDDANPAVNPAARELCDDASDFDCDGNPGVIDADGDGVAACDDCDDDDKDVRPGAEESCNDADDDCDGSIDEDPTDATDFFVDLDGDGAGSSRLVVAACEAPAGFADAADDCDDLHAESFPNAAELCDGLDNDCNGTVDDGATGTSTYWVDADKDGFGDLGGEVDACVRPVGYVDNYDDCNDADAKYQPNATESCTDLTDYNCDGSVGQTDGDADGTPACTDCDDANPDVEPGAPEVCDGLDNDCNGTIDEVAPTWYADVDGDGVGGKALFVVACDAPGGFVSTKDDCDDLDPSVLPGATEVCNGADDDCSGAPGALETDVDGDRWLACGGDCDDAVATTHPGRVELCDAVDNDCDGTPDDAAADAKAIYTDADNDGFGDGSATFGCAVGAGQSAVAGDCDDGAPAVFPAAVEACNAADDDCDGAVDESGSTGSTTYFLDADGDGVGSSKVSTSACAAPPGYVSTSTDCDDTDARAYPGATELCDGVDNNCDKASLAGEADADKDGWRACANDCNDTVASINPNAPETCNTKDDDCDTVTDEGAVDAPTWFADLDGDGYGNTASTQQACGKPANTSALGGDCDDGAKAISPASDELCATVGVDDDCDALVDESGARDAAIWFLDADVDGHGVPTNFSLACTQPAGRVAAGDDCNDGDKTVYSGAVEVWYDGVDSNCDGKSDFDQDGDGYISSKFGGNDCVDTDKTTLGCAGTSQASAVRTCAAVLAAEPTSGSGLYWIDPDNDGNTSNAFQVYCDMATAAGGWTLALNLDTSDGHVMWWANPLWTSNAVHGTLATTFDGDLKSQAWMDYTGATELLLVVHQQGTVVGWKRFSKPNTNTMYTYLQGGDNTVIGSAVLGSSTGSVWASERLVRSSTSLYANHCVNVGGACTSGNTGSPDGDRIGSNEGDPSNNNGGGLGNWHDMNYCCSGSFGSGKTCNGSTFRTASEAQAGWSYQAGTFGSDSYQPMSGTQSDSSCSTANWAAANGVAYDYALYLK